MRRVAGAVDGHGEHAGAAVEQHQVVVGRDGGAAAFELVAVLGRIEIRLLDLHLFPIDVEFIRDDLRQSDPKLDALLVSGMQSMCAMHISMATLVLGATWFGLRRGERWTLWALALSVLVTVPYYLLISSTVQPEFSAALVGVKPPERAIADARARLSYFLGAIR